MKKASSVFKYTHKDKITFSKAQKITFSILFIISLITFLAVKPLGIVIFILSLIIFGFSFPRRTINLTPRYLICGNTLIYYRNINKIMADYANQSIHFYSDGKKVFTLEQNLFPTNARKPDKILNNKRAKFQKVSDKLIDKIIKASPNLELEGVKK